jgi:TolB-like protein
LLYLFADFALDTERRELRCKHDLVSIEPQVFDLLTYLIDNRKRVVSKDDLIAAVWEGRIVSDATLDSRVNAARRAIGDSGGLQRLIKTLPRKGIRFVGAVREEEKPAEPALAPRTAEGVEHPPRVALSLPERPSIAVLPFVNMSRDPEQEYFVDGMAEEIITALARCSWLFVIARNSSFTYKNKVVDVRQIGRELGVRYVLEGSVRRVGDRLRRQKRGKGFASPRARSKSPKTTATSCGWRPLRSGSWPRMVPTLATSPTVRCGSIPTRPWP